MWWKKYEKIPFKDKGRDENGCDCYGLGRLIYRNELKIELPDLLDAYDSVDDKPTLERIIEEDQKKNWIESPWPAPFDFAVIRMAGLPIHIGIVTKVGYLLHCKKDVNTLHVPYTGPRANIKVLSFNRWVAA